MSELRFSVYGATVERARALGYVGPDHGGMQRHSAIDRAAIEILRRAIELGLTALESE